MDLDGAIDLHVHTAPDVYPRSVRDDQLVSRAAAAGMAGVMLKSHHTLTADRATLASVASGLPVFGGLALNWPVGGLNPIAVETALAMGARQIWMPTLHAAHCLADATQPMFRAEAEKGRVGLTVFEDAARTRLKPEVVAILELVRDADAILGSGHLAPEETLSLLRQARAMGLGRLLVTHPLMSFTRFTAGQMREAVELGARLEFDYLSCSPHWGDAVSPDETAAAIARVGAEHCVLATDGGQTFNPPPAKMLDDFAAALTERGIGPAALRTMMCENPARLVGLR